MLFGAHVSSAGGISKAIDRAAELGCDAVQVFTQSPRMWRPTAHGDEEVARFRARRAEAGIEAVVCHALYLVNLAGSDRELHEKSVTAMRASLETASAIGAEGVVFAAPSFCDPALLERPMLQDVLGRHKIPYTAFKYAENTGQMAPIREQAGTFADSIKLWSAA